MGYSVGIQTKSKEEAEQILKYINENIPSTSSAKNDLNFNYYGLHWNAGKDLSYIPNDDFFGVNYSDLDDFESSYLYSLFYAIAFKFNLNKKINNIDCVIVNYDNESDFYLAKENPFSIETEKDKYYSFVKINEDGLKTPYEKKGLFSFLSKKLSKKDLLNIKNVINDINS